MATFKERAKRSEAMTRAPVSVRLDRAEARLARQRAEKKAMKMRLTEAGGFAVATLGTGFLDTKVPIGLFDGAVKWGHLFLAGGAVMLLLTKGTTQELGSGMVYGGAGPILYGFGQTLAERFG